MPGPYNRAMEGRLQTVFDASPVAIVEVDLEARVRLWNPAAERIFGWPADEILGQTVPYVPPERQAEFDETVALVRAGKAFTGLETVRRVLGDAAAAREWAKPSSCASCRRRSKASSFGCTCKSRVIQHEKCCTRQTRRRQLWE